MVAKGYLIEREVKARYGSTPNEVLAAELGISQNRLERVARRACLGKDKASFPGRKMPRWDEVEEAHLRDHYAHTPNIQLARDLGKSIKSITSKAQHMGLAKSLDRLIEMGRQNVSIRYGKAYKNP